MTTKKQLEVQWKAWLNGAIHAVVDAVIWGGAGAFAVFTGAISRNTALLIVLTAIGSGLRGYYTKAPLPDLFVVEEETTLPSGAVVSTTTTVTGAPGAGLAAIQESKEQVVQEKKDAAEVAARVAADSEVKTDVESFRPSKD